jgi:hypothetical protein
MDGLREAAVFPLSLVCFELLSVSVVLVVGGHGFANTMTVPGYVEIVVPILGGAEMSDDTYERPDSWIRHRGIVGVSCALLVLVVSG